jgi:hypothetical protein
MRSGKRKLTVRQTKLRHLLRSNPERCDLGEEDGIHCNHGDGWGPALWEDEA